MATGAVACGVCCVLPFAFPAVAAASTGSLLAWFAGAHNWVTALAGMMVAGPGGIRIQSSHLSGEVESLEGIDQGQLQKIAQETRERCTISIALEGSVAITYDIVAR